MRKLGALTAWCSVAFFALGVSLGVGAESWRISPKDASCLLENLEAYKSTDDNPIIVFLEVCPEVDRQKAIAALQQNSAPGLRETEDGTFDSVIVLTKDELDCIGQIANRSDLSIGLTLQRPISCSE